MIEQDPKPQSLDSPQLVLMKTKFQQLKEKSVQKFPLFYELQPIDQNLYQDMCKELCQKLDQNQENPVIAGFWNLLLGAIEGSSGEKNQFQCLASKLNFKDKQFWEGIFKKSQQKLSSKISAKNYGMPKSKTHTVWETKNLSDLEPSFNTEPIKHHRKISKQYGTFYRGLLKFIEKFEKLSKNEGFEEKNIKQLYEDYTKIGAEQKKYLKLLDKNSKETENKCLVKVQSPVAVQNNGPVKEDKGEQGEKGEKSEKDEKGIKIEEGVKDEKEDKEQKTKKGSKKLKKPKQEQGEKEKNEQGQISSEKQKKQAKKKEPTSSHKKTNKSQQQKQIIQQQYKTLDLMFLTQKKKQQSNKDALQEKQAEAEKMQEELNSTDFFFESLKANIDGQPTTPILDLKNNFKNLKKEKKHTVNITCYVNIVVNKSRLEYYDYMITQPKINFSNPLEDVDNVRYEDSSDEYSELVADSINEDMVQQQDEEDAQFQSNSAIVPDSYCEYQSNHCFSSDEEESQTPEKIIKPQIVKGNKWSFSRKSQTTSLQYSLSGDNNRNPLNNQMIVLTEQQIPFSVKQSAQESQNDEINAITKVEMYKQIHGSFIPKDNLIKKVSSIVENKISQNKLNNLMKDLTEKKGTQRVIKPEIVKQITEELAEIAPNLEDELQQLRKERQAVKIQEMETKREERNNEKQQKLEKQILLYEGTMTLKDILEYLKTKDIKILKADLNNFIKNHEGEEWEKIREAIKENKLKRGRKPKHTQNEEVKNSHRSIQQILKQNEIDFANRPKKIRRNSEEMIEASQFQRKHNHKQDESDSQQYQDQEDQSFDIKAKKKRIGKNMKPSKKRVPMIQCSIPGSGSVRRNPRRNKAKPSLNNGQGNHDDLHEMQEQKQQEKMEEQQVCEAQIVIQQSDEHKIDEEVEEKEVEVEENNQNGQLIKKGQENTANKDEKSKSDHLGEQINAPNQG